MRRFEAIKKHHRIASIVATYFVSVISLSIFLACSYGLPVWGQVRLYLSVRAIPQCQNSIDDDGDTLIDYPSDPDCSNASDISEGIPLVPPTVVCFAPSTNGTVGQVMTWIAIPSNGNGVYTYTWSGADGLTGTTASVAQGYNTVGTKTASLMVTSGGLSSAVIPCVNSIIVAAPPSGGGGGGGGAVVIPKPPIPSLPGTTDNNPEDVPPLNAAPSGEEEHPDCTIPTLTSTFQDYKDYLVCDALITPRITEEQYEYKKHTPRKELLGVAVELALKDKNIAIREGLERLSSAKKSVEIVDVGLPRPFHFFDVGLEGQPQWIAKTVEKGVILGLISTENNLFRPDDNITRAEAFGMLMKSICMNPGESAYPTWEERVYATAKKYNLTTRDWRTFQPQSSILRQELFVITTKLDLWRDNTGGCTPRSTNKALPVILQTLPNIDMPPLSSAPPSSVATTNRSDISEQPSQAPVQKPGTFALLYENESEKVYAYIVKSGGIPDGVRLQYLRIFGGNKNLSSRLLIHDIAGIEFAEDRFFLSGELIYMTLQK